MRSWSCFFLFFLSYFLFWVCCKEISFYFSEWAGLRNSAILIRRYEDSENTDYVLFHVVSWVIGTLILAPILKNNRKISITNNTNNYNPGQNIWKKVKKNQAELDKTGRLSYLLLRRFWSLLPKLYFWNRGRA